MNEQSYIQGSRRAWLHMLTMCLYHLAGVNHPLKTRARLVAEREEAIQALRSICEECGDNDWDEGLHLADIIDKHLGKHLLSK